MADLTFKSQADMEAFALSPAQKTESPKLKASVPTTSPTSVPAATDLLSSIDEQLKQAVAEPDAMKAAQHLSTVRGAIAAEDARFFKEAQATAYAEFGVQRLSETLQQNMQMDRATPAYYQKYGDADSDETAAVRKQLMTAKAAADGSIPERLKGNPTYTSLIAKAKTTEALITDTVTKGLSKEADLDRKASEFYYSMPGDQKILFDKAIGNTDSDPRMAMANVARFARVPWQMQQLEQVLQGGERAVPSLALAGNIFAKKIALDAETKIFGDKEVAAKKLREVEKIAMDSNEAAAAWKQLKMDKGFSARVGPEKIKAQDTAVSMMIAKAGSGGKQAQQEYASLRASIAEDFANIKAQTDFDGDILALRNDKGIQAPSWLAEAGKDPAVGKIDKVKAMALVNKAPTMQEKQSRMNQLVEFYGAAAERQQGSLFFRVNPLVKEQLKVEISLFSVVGDFFSRTGLPDLGAAVSTITPPAGYYEPRPATPQQLYEYNGEMLSYAEYQKRSGEDYYKPLKGVK